MPVLKRAGSVDLNQDLDFTHTEWKVERIGWAIFALLLLAALLGLFGHGPLSKAQAGAAGSPVWVEYQSLDRYQAPTQIRIHVGPNAAQEGKLRLVISRDYIDRLEIVQVTPEQDAVELGAGELTYVFSVSEPAEPAEVVFDVEFVRFGAASAQIGLDQGPQISYRQFVFP